MIVVHTYGKVASQSLLAQLGRIAPEVYYSHGLQSSTIEVVTRYLAVKPDDTGLRTVFSSAETIRTTLEATLAAGRDVVLIAGLRDPIARSLSAAMQNLEHVFADCIADDPDDTARLLARSIADAWEDEGRAVDSVRRMADMIVRAPLTWLEDEIERPFGLDLGATAFDTERGYGILSKDNLKLLLFRLENAPAAIEAGLATLFPDRKIAVPRSNVSDEKSDAHRDLYRRLKSVFRLAPDRLSAIYASRYVRHFYSEAEIAASIARWAGSLPDEPRRVGPDPVRASPSSAAHTFRATVVVTLWNRRAHVGALIDSLLQQWDERLHLLVIDDGSTDDGLDVVRDRLRGAQNIAATFLRNPSPLGLGVLPALLRHASSDIIIQCDSDDIALPRRIATILDRFEQDASCRLVTSNAVLISDDRIPIGLYDTDAGDETSADILRWASETASTQRLGATSAFHRSLFDDFAPLDFELFPYGLDMVLALRAAMTGTLHYISEPLVLWRQHSQNAHRLAGAFDIGDEARERYEILEVMALGQKVRDVESLQARRGTQTLDVAKASVQTVFLRRFEQWSRVRNRLPARSLQPGGATTSCVPIPPIATLMPGRRETVALGTRLGAIIGQWSGFHDPEERQTWTKRSALVTLRRGDRSSRVLTIGFGWLPGLDQRARFSIDFQIDRGVTVASQGGISEVDLPLGDHDCFTVLIEAFDADRPIRAGVNEDGRLLGVCLQYLELRDGAPDAAGSE